MEHEDAERHRPLSAVLRDICEDLDEELTLGEVTRRFGPRAFGALLFVLAIPNLLPLPPGATTILGAPIVILAPQLAFGVRRPWMPRALESKPIRREWFRRAYRRVGPALEAAEKVSRPRIHWLFTPLADRVLGLVCTALALVLIMPIPLGNIMPSVTIGVFGLALVQRDGIVALAGYALAGLSAGLLTVGFAAAWIALRHLLEAIGWM